MYQSCGGSGGDGVEVVVVMKLELVVVVVVMVVVGMVVVEVVVVVVVLVVVDVEVLEEVVFVVVMMVVVVVVEVVVVVVVAEDEEEEDVVMVVMAVAVVMEVPNVVVQVVELYVEVESQLTQEYVEQVPNIGTIEVPVELARNVINEAGNKEEESAEEDTNFDGRRRRLEFDNSADESNKEIYESDNDAALDDNNEFDVAVQSNFRGVGNTYPPKNLVVVACEEYNDTNSGK
ncbi:unnamed protein product [Prunus armeniaca]